jgi:hypothetical protein
MPETNVGLRYELGRVADLNSGRHLVSKLSTCQLQAGREVRGGAPAADDRPPVSVRAKE